MHIKSFLQNHELKRNGNQNENYHQNEIMVNMHKYVLKKLKRKIKKHFKKPKRKKGTSL